MNLFWKIESPVYHFLRSMPGIAWILANEKRNLAAVIANEDIQCPILDIGTGTGSTLDIFPVSTPVIAVDSSIDMLSRAVVRNPGLIPVVACAEELPFKPLSLQFISCIGVSEYLRKPEAVVNQLNSVLKESGRLLTTFPSETVFNRLRLMLGHRIYLNKGEFLGAFSRTAAFDIKENRRTWLQIQILFIKRKK